MPLYDYRCAACGREVEVMHRIDAPGPEACGVCGGPMSKLLSSPAIHFKGSGWAKKDAAAASATKAKSSSTTDADTSSASATDAAKGKDAGEGGTPAATGKAEPATSTSTTSD